MKSVFMNLSFQMAANNSVSCNDIYLHFICSGTSDLALGILKILIPLCFREVLKPAIEQFAPGMM